MKKFKVTEEMSWLKCDLVNARNRQSFLESKVFPFIVNNIEVHNAKEACVFFGMKENEIHDLYIWNWVSETPDDHVDKIRRRVEDFLRKTNPIQIIKTADFLGVNTEL